MPTEAISIEGVSVLIGMPVDNPIPHHTSMALAMTMYAAGRKHMPVSIAIEVSGIVQAGRDCVLDDFLKSDFDKLFWIDSDMVWKVDDFFKMVALSTRYDIVCASYPLKRDGPKSFVCKYQGETLPRDPLGLCEVDGVGLGFTIISRNVAEAVVKDKPRVTDQMTGREMAAAFRVDIHEGNRRTEDMAFFADAQEAGFKIMMDPEIELGHIGEKQWRGAFIEAFQGD